MVLVQNHLYRTANIDRNNKEANYSCILNLVDERWMRLDSRENKINCVHSLPYQLSIDTMYNWCHDTQDIFLLGHLDEIERAILFLVFFLCCVQCWVCTLSPIHPLCLAHVVHTILIAFQTITYTQSIKTSGCHVSQTLFNSIFFLESTHFTKIIWFWNEESRFVRKWTLANPIYKHFHHSTTRLKDFSSFI